MIPQMKSLLACTLTARTLDYGEGREAIRLFLKEGQAIGMVREDLDVDSIVFVGSGE